MTDAVNGPPPYFIRDQSQTEDAFGAHSRLAAAMEQALGANPPLAVVGLFGGWGSGKSTVIHYLEKRMASPTTHFFMYDAWVHQSDTPRRAFLETLIRFLRQRELADTTSLETQLERLLRKTEVVEIESTPQVSRVAGLVLSLLLLAPLATAFLRKDWADVEGGEYFIPVLGYEIGAVFASAVAVVALPFLSLTLLNFVRLVQSRRKDKQDAAAAAIALFANKVQEKRRDLKRTDPEPTALEFQAFFRTLLGLVHKDKGKRLIVVIDNLDRLPDGELLSLWSSIRSLFHGDDRPDAPAESPAQLPTVILPLDFAALERLHPNTPALAQGFADKTFDVVFRVPGPVTSQWQAYLGERLKQVFGEALQENWIGEACRILEEGDVDSRLPRAINIYVNDVATLWMQWRDGEVSFAAMAYYAANRAGIEKSGWLALRQPASWMNEIDPDWTLGVAAIRYGAPPAIAGQILIEQPLLDALARRDEAAFGEISRRPGFGSVLRRILATYRTNSTSLPIRNVAYLLSKLDHTTDLNLREAWGSLAEGLSLSDAWSPAAAEDAEAFELALAHNPKPLRARMQKGLRDQILRRSHDGLAAGATSLVALVRRAHAAADADGHPAPPVVLPDGPKLAIAVAQASGKDIGLFTIDLPSSVLADQLVQLVGSGELADDVRPAVEALIVWRDDIAWIGVADAALDLMGERGAATFRALGRLIGEVWRAAPAARTHIMGSLGRPALLDHVNNLIDARDHEGAGMAFALLLLPPEPPAWVGRAFEKARDQIGLGAQHIDPWLATFATEVSLDDLVSRTARQPEVRALVQELVRARIARDAASLSPPAVLRRLELYASLLSAPEDGPIWRQLLERRKFWRHLNTRQVDASHAAEAYLLVQLAGDGAGLPSARRHLARTLAAASTEDWVAAMRGNGDLYKGLADLSPAEWTTIASGLAAALVKAAPAVATDADADFADRWLAATRRLQGRPRRAALRALADRLVRPGAVAATRLLHAGGPELTQLVRSPARSPGLLTNVLGPALASSAELVWLAAEAERLTPAMRSAPKEAAKIRESITKRLKTTELAPNQRSLLERIAATWEARDEEQPVGPPPD